MVVLNKIYTRTGDKGTTALSTGERVAKSDARIMAYGTVDETNAAVGLAREFLGDSDPDMSAMLQRVQNDLFDLGADLATPERPGQPDKELEFEPLRIVDTQVARIEAEIDTLNKSLEPLRSFVLPGGSKTAAALHMARTVCRRAERHMVELASDEGELVSDAAMRYINRLSDFLFVASRYVNDKGRGDVLWSPGKNR